MLHITLTRVYTIAHIKTLYKLFTWFSINECLTVVLVRDDYKKYVSKLIIQDQSHEVALF